MSEVKKIPKLRFPQYGNPLTDVGFTDLGKIMIGLTHTPNYITTGRPFLSSKNISQGFIDFENIKYISEDEFQNLPKGAKPIKGDILFTRVGSNLGNPIVLDVNIEFGIFVSLGIFRVNKNANNFYVKFWMDTNYFWRQLEQKVAGGAKNNLNTNWLKEFRLNLPSLAEQQKIADFLTAVDKRVELLEKKKTLLETYKKGVMKKIFNQEIRFKDDSGKDFPDWEKKRLGELSPKMKSGGTPKSTIKDHYDGDIPFLSIGDMTSQNKYLNWTSKTISKRGLENSSSWVVPKNSIIYSMYASVGFVSINKIDLSISQAVMAIQPIDEMNLEFLYYSLLNFQPKIKSLIETGTQGNINGGIVKNIPIETPSLNEQIKISEFLSSLDTQIELLETQIDKSKTWKKGLLQKMFV